MSHTAPLYSLDSPDLMFAQATVRRLVASGFTAYFAGGCVRDALMGNAPQDFDVATNALTDQVREVFGASHTRAVGEAFGVVLVHGRMQGKVCQVEVATFRSDGSYSDGRRPDWVTFSTPEQDAERRDFTINGLFYDPIHERVIDFVGGQEDLKRGLLRAIGDPYARLREDKLRMLRAIRFASRFGFELDPSTRQAIEASAPQIQVVSGERIGIEIKKMLEHPTRAVAWEMLISTGLTAHLLPELHARWNDPHRRSVELQWLEKLPSTTVGLPVALAALIHPWISEPQNAQALEGLLDAMQDRWKLSNSHMDATRFVLTHAEVLLMAHHKPWSTIQPLLTSRFIRDALAFAEVMAQVSSLDRAGIASCREQLSKPESEWNPPSWLHGGDLIAVGLKPGPKFASILFRARALQLDGQLGSRADALAWLAETAREPTGPFGS